MNVFEKDKNDRVPFLSSKPRPNKGRNLEHLAVNRQQTPFRSGNGSFYNEDGWLPEIEEHEQKSDTSEKQSVEMNSLKPF